jgi:hypothetical protein
MKVLFLDVDGVLNGYSKFTGLLYWCFVRLKMMKFVNKHYDIFGVRTHKVRLLSKIIKRTGAKVVISSSWRGGWYQPYEEKKNRQKSLHDKLTKFNIEVIGITPRVSKGDHYSHRESEIKQWITECGETINSFVILDDESYDLQSFVGKELIKTSEVKEGEMIRGSWYENTGLKRKHVNQAIKILNM